MVAELSKERISSVANKLNELSNLLSEENRKADKKLKFCLSIITSMDSDFKEWIDNCPFSVKTTLEYISERYIKLDGITDELYLTCGRFLREYILSKERRGYKDSWIAGDWYSFKNEAKDFIKVENNHRLNYLISGQFDIDVINHYLGDRSLQAFLNYEDTLSNAKIEMGNLNSNLEYERKTTEDFLKMKEERVNILAKKLEEQETAFNFVGLSKGFEKLLKDKEDSKVSSFWFVLLIGVSIVIIPTLFIFFLLRTPELINNPNLWKGVIPFTGLEIILLYFFRVVLSHYNSIKTQIMQIELRQSLCQFIQNYAEYAKVIKEKDDDLLEKFENLIFSNILSTPDKLPSTFDGMEQLANLIKTIK